MRAACCCRACLDFQRANPDLEIRIETPPVNPDFRNPAMTLPSCSAKPRPKGLLSDVLMRERWSPLASPELIKAGWPDLKAMIAKAPLLHIRQGNDSWHDWRQLARQVGFAGLPVERGLVVETADQAVQAALSGGGVVVVDPMPLRRRIDARAIAGTVRDQHADGPRLHTCLPRRRNRPCPHRRLPQPGP